MTSSTKTALAALFWIRPNGQGDNIFKINTPAFLTTVSQANGLQMLDPRIPAVSHDVVYASAVRGVPRNAAFAYKALDGTISFGSPGVLQTSYLVYFSMPSLGAVKIRVSISSAIEGGLSLTDARTSANQTSVAPPGWTVGFGDDQLNLAFDPALLSAGELPFLPVLSVLLDGKTNLAIVKVSNVQPLSLSDLTRGLQVQCVLADASGTLLEPAFVQGPPSKGPGTLSPSSPPSAPTNQPSWIIGVAVGVGGIVLLAIVLLALFLSRKRIDEASRG